MLFTGPVEDRLAIRELMDTHAHGVMAKDPELWGSIWAEDAYWALPEYPDLGGFSGKAAIVAAWTASLQRYGLNGGASPMVYFMQPGAIAVTGDTATAIAYTIEIYDDLETGKRVHGTGRYDDQLKKIDGRWLFTRREYRTVFVE